MKTARIPVWVRAGLAGCLLLSPVAAGSAESPWIALGDGLELGRFPLPGRDAQVQVLRVDPRRWELTLHGLRSGDSGGYTAREWSRREGLAAAINAGLYQADYRTHSGYMRADGTVFSRGTNGYLSAAAFDPVNPNDPPFRIFELDDDPLATVLQRYRRVVQNLRLVKRPAENRWAPQQRRWSEAALGEDREGRALLIFCGAPLPLDRLIEALLALPLGLVAAQHLEGGSQAQFFVAAGGQTIELVGGYEGILSTPDADRTAWPIPNVIGVRARGGR
ncbi:MAG: phosphodiester glycosidase family protein [Candidatus Methylomirabilia bacterium]